MIGRIKTKVRLLKHQDIARFFEVDARTVRRWVGRGLWPEPHSILERTWYFEAEIVEHYINTGEWPAEARFKKGEGRGREA